MPPVVCTGFRRALAVGLLTASGCGVGRPRSGAGAAGPGRVQFAGRCPGRPLVPALDVDLPDSSAGLVSRPHQPARTPCPDVGAGAPGATAPFRLFRLGRLGRLVETVSALATAGRQEELPRRVRPWYRRRGAAGGGPALGQPWYVGTTPTRAMVNGVCRK